MVLGRRIEEWLERDDTRREESRKRVENLLNQWLAQYSIPNLSVLQRTDPKQLTKEQRAFLDHIIDVVKNRHCTDSACPHHNDTIPDWIQ